MINYMKVSKLGAQVPIRKTSLGIIFEWYGKARNNHLGVWNGGFATQVLQ